MGSVVSFLQAARLRIPVFFEAICWWFCVFLLSAVHPTNSCIKHKSYHAELVPAVDWKTHTIENSNSMLLKLAQSHFNCPTPPPFLWNWLKTVGVLWGLRCEMYQKSMPPPCFPTKTLPASPPALRLRPSGTFLKQESNSERCPCTLSNAGTRSFTSASMKKGGWGALVGMGWAREHYSQTKQNILLSQYFYRQR